MTDSEKTRHDWETPTLTVLGDIETLTAIGNSNGTDSLDTSAGV